MCTYCVFTLWGILNHVNLMFNTTTSLTQQCAEDFERWLHLHTNSCVAIQSYISVFLNSSISDTRAGLCRQFNHFFQQNFRNRIKEKKRKNLK